MSNLPVLPWDAVSTHDRKIVTTSLMVAEVFGKRHDNVLRSIQQITGPKTGASDNPIAAFTGLNFEASEYIDPTGRKLPTVEMTKDGFTLLAMGYTGEKAMLFKIAYIAEFNRMAERLAKGDNRKAIAAERAYFQRYPVDRQIRDLAMVGEPYWFIARIVGRAAGTVGNAIRRMLHWGVMDTAALTNARTGMTIWWRHRRKFSNQLTLGF